MRVRSHLAAERKFLLTAERCKRTKATDTLKVLCGYLPEGIGSGETHESKRARER